jgi:hypothetical protein
MGEGEAEPMGNVAEMRVIVGDGEREARDEGHERAEE